jgi:hypothetical protein
VTLSPSAVSGNELFALRPVPKSWGGKPGEVNIIAKDRRIGCARFLSASSTCSDLTLSLVDRDDGSGLQRWTILTAMLPSNSPSPAVSSFPSPPPPFPSPSPSSFSFSLASSSNSSYPCESWTNCLSNAPVIYHCSRYCYASHTLMYLVMYIDVHCGL